MEKQKDNVTSTKKRYYAIKKNKISIWKNLIQLDF